jgi:hypothetical protein
VCSWLNHGGSSSGCAYGVCACAPHIRTRVRVRTDNASAPPAVSCSIATLKTNPLTHIAKTAARRLRAECAAGIARRA